MSCNFKEQSKIVRTGGIPLRGRRASSQDKLSPTMWKMCKCWMRTRFPGAELGPGEWGRGGKNNEKRFHSLTYQHINGKLKTKIANTVLLLFALSSPSGVLWHPSASLYSGADPIKGSPSWQPALSRLHYILQSTSLWRRKSATAIVSLCYFPAEILLHIVYISNLLCGLEVIDSRRLQ